MRFDLDDCYALLPRVSRTFALNIRILPGELKPSVTVAYLLFRLADLYGWIRSVSSSDERARLVLLSGRER